jgi:hypothetical protein
MSHLWIIFPWSMFYQIKQSNINKYITDAHSIWSIYISSKRDLKEKIQLASNRSLTISHARPYLITIESTKQMWLHSNMYFQKSISVTYLFITYYPSMESFRSRTKVNTPLLSLLPLFLATPNLITQYILFVPCEFFVSPCTKQSLSKYH